MDKSVMTNEELCIRRLIQYFDKELEGNYVCGYLLDGGVHIIPEQRCSKTHTRLEEDKLRLFEDIKSNGEKVEGIALYKGFSHPYMDCFARRIISNFYHPLCNQSAIIFNFLGDYEVTNIAFEKNLEKEIFNNI